MALLKPAQVVERRVGARLDAAVIAIDGLMPADLGVLEADRPLLGGEQFDVRAQRTLIILERQHVIGLLGEDVPGEFALAANRIDGDDGALDRQHSSSLGMATISFDLSTTLT